jgi:tetratricopeptide (TPR) repeat protein
MRTIAAIVLAAAGLWARPAAAQDEYAAVLLEYLTGDATAAVSKVRELPYAQIDAGIEAFNETHSRLILSGAAALHTEAAFSRDGNLVSEYHLGLATAIVEFGEAAKGLKPNSRTKLMPRFAQPVSDEFRRIWYCAVIQALESSAALARVDRYLAHALALYPTNPELQLLAGTAEEIRTSPRTSNVNEGARRHALEQAEKHYRAVIAAEPDRLEARLRLGRVLQQRGVLAEARQLLTPLATSRENRLAYLASLFLGGIEDHDGHAEKAADLYLGAITRMPEAQAARLATSELLHRQGDRATAAAAIPAATGPGNNFDPWWTYPFGEYWRVDLLLSAIRAKRRV